VAVRVRPHKTLKRQGDDLFTELEIDMTQAALGDELTLRGVDGEEQVTIHAGTQPGDIITLRRKGVPRLRGSGRGDLHVICRVKIPRHLSKRQRELLEELAGRQPGEANKSNKKKRRLFS
jgi:molecular chaperone DnaJ